MDDEVHEFASDNVPGTAYPRRDTEYGDNGLMNMYAQHKHRHHKRDIAERAMDEEVHGFASDNVRGIAWGRSEVPYGDNGMMNVYSQQKKNKHFNPFIAERKMDEDVHGFVSDAINNPLGPSRNDEPYPMNGYKNVYPDVDHSQSGQTFTAEDFDTAADYVEGGPSYENFGQRKHRKHHRDIAERKMDSEVHGFVKSALPPLKERVRNEVPYQANGW